MTIQTREVVNLTIIGVQTAAALRVFDGDPGRAREALETVARTNRHALAELRETVDLLRSPDGADDGDDAERRAPTGGLADLPALVESARSAGALAELRADLVPDGAVTPSVERTVYRIVQESLTNALRHAPGATVTVALEHRVDALLVRIVDDGPGLRAGPEGRGLGGMRERAAAVGGSLTITSRETGGVAVCAHLPTGHGGTR